MKNLTLAMIMTVITTFEIFRDGFITDEIFDLDNDLSVENIKRIVWCKCSDDNNEIIDLELL